MRQRWAILGWLAPIALMLLLVTTNVRLVTNSLTVYTALFERHDVSQRTGIRMESLRDVGRQIQDYFNSDTEPLRVTATVNGVPRELFNELEASHMADVKQLFLRTYRVQAASALFLLLVSVLAWVQLRRGALREFAHWLWRGGVLTLGVIGALGIGSIVAFDALFTLFHYIGFPQGNWTFDPRTDYLVRVFPFGFWQDVTLLIGGLTVLLAALAIGAGWVARRQLRPAETRAQRLPRTPREAAGKQAR